jgi:hypothetical protein
MPLDKKQVKTLLSAVANTCENELDCDECLAGMAEFAEKQLVGAEVSDALERIRVHLALCTECCEEYEALLEIVRSEGSSR